MRRGLFSLVAVLAATAATGEDRTQAFDAGWWRQGYVTTVQIDNDLFAPSSSDRDYTGGLALSIPQHDEPRPWNPEAWLGPIAERELGKPTLRALQVQILAFSPGELSESGALSSDRPYASLWAIAGARQRIDHDNRRTRFASLTVGALGLHLTRSLHEAIHRATGTEIPEGYDHQISAGGEPTAKLTIAERRLLSGGGLGRGSDVWTTIGASVGYLTEASVAIGARWGDRGAPWWASGAELADYAPAPDFGVAPLGAERTLEAGVRLHVRAYNAFLQGQFRHSDVRLGFSETEPLVLDAWVGGTMAIASGWRLSYRTTARTPELREGQGSRTQVWGSVALTRSF